MKVLIFAVVALLAAARAEEFIREVAPEVLTGYDYHNRFGIAEAARIKLAEEEMLQDPSRIVGGTPSALGANPWLVGLVITLANGATSVCSASLLTSTRLITAAHCWFDGRQNARQFEASLGSIHLFHGGTRRFTSIVTIHPNYSPNTLNNDIAIANIGSVAFTSTIQSVSLATGSGTYVGTWAVAAGYGRTSDNAGISNNQVQSHVSVQVIANNVCAQTYSTSVVVGSTICVSTAGGRGTCGGDSGGPLVANNQLIGVTSFGHSSGCQRGFPAGFARVTSFVSWIQARL